MSHHQVKNQIYKYALNCIDIATCSGFIYPLKLRDSTSIAKALEKLFKSRYCPKIFIVDKGTEFVVK